MFYKYWGKENDQSRRYVLLATTVRTMDIQLMTTNVTNTVRMSQTGQCLVLGACDESEVICCLSIGLPRNKTRPTDLQYQEDIEISRLR